MARCFRKKAVMRNHCIRVSAAKRCTAPPCNLLFASPDGKTHTNISKLVADHAMVKGIDQVHTAGPSQEQLTPRVRHLALCTTGKRSMREYLRTTKSLGCSMRESVHTCFVLWHLQLSSHNSRALGIQRLCRQGQLFHALTTGPLACLVCIVPHPSTHGQAYRKQRGLTGILWAG